MKRSLPLLVLFLLSGCSHVFYQPAKKHYFNPNQFNEEYRNIVFPSRDGTKLHAWFLPTKTKIAKGTFIQFHGNAENISTFFRSMSWVTELGYNLFIFDYRGYGHSEGSPSQEGINHDAIAALDYAFHNYYKKGVPLVIYGQSLGGTIALRAIPEFFEAHPQARDAVQLVVIDSSFMNYKKLAAEKLSGFWLTWPIQWMAYLVVSNSYSPEDWVAKISPTPLVVVHGSSDATVPIEHGRAIYEKANPPKTFWEIPGGTHIQAMWTDDRQYRRALIQYLTELKQARESQARPQRGLPH